MKLFWNWVNNGHDFCFFIWDLLGGRYAQDEKSDNSESEVVYQFDAYDQVRNQEPEYQIVRIFHKLEELGYIRTYTIKPTAFHPMWVEYAKSDASLDVALVDPSFRHNRLVMEQIELLLWTPREQLREEKYFLTDNANRQYLSTEPGCFGGHNKLKIYGRLDCPSANSFIRKGKYITHRVFFPNEATAIKAGYRPCAKCMPEQYKAWKNRQYNVGGR